MTLGYDILRNFTVFTVSIGKSRKLCYSSNGGNKKSVYNFSGNL